MLKLLILSANVFIYSNSVNANNGTTIPPRKDVIKKNTTQTSIVNQAITTTTRRPFLQGLKLPCSCVEGQCGCCTGIVLDRFNQKACVNVSYEPDDFALTTTLSMNQRILFKRTVSGKNPAPMCAHLPRLQFIRFCVQFSNIYLASRNIHFCIDMEADWQDLTLVEWSFDCIRMGVSGVAVVGPEEGGGLPANPIDAVDQTDEDYDDSARIVPKIKHQKNSLIHNHCSYVDFDGISTKNDLKKLDKSLVKVKLLPNHYCFISYDKPSTKKMI